MVNSVYFADCGGHKRKFFCGSARTAALKLVARIFATGQGFKKIVCVSENQFGDSDSLMFLTVDLLDELGYDLSRRSEIKTGLDYRPSVFDPCPPMAKAV